MGQLHRDGVALAYEEAGSGAPPLVLVHDLGSDHTCFAPQFEYFRRHHRVVAVDLRGHGQSGGPRGACSVDLLADDLAWLCYELGLYRPVLLGRGLGAAVVLDLAARYQDLSSAIVVATPAETSSPMPAPARSLTLLQHGATPRLESIALRDRSDSVPWSAAPVLHVALGTGKAELPEEINLLVDEFFSGLAGRVPPARRSSALGLAT